LQTLSIEREKLLLKKDDMIRKKNIELDEANNKIKELSKSLLDADNKNNQNANVPEYVHS